MIRYIIIVLFVFLNGNLLSQGQPSMRVQFDKPLYSAGEIVWFAIFKLDSGSFHQSQEVIHFELLSSRNERVYNGKVLMKGRLANGYFKLSNDLEEGYYRFRAFTLRSLREGSEYIVADIPIYSEWRKDLEVYKFGELPEPKTEKQDIEIDRRTKTYNRRDTIELSNLITDNTEDWQYVFWVSPSEYDNFPGIKSEVKIVPQSIQMYSNIEKEDSLYFEASLTTVDSGKGVSSPLISIYSSHNKRFYRSKATDGRLSLKIPYYEGESILQVFNLNPYQDAVSKLNVRDWIIGEGYYNSSKPVVTPEIAEYLIKAKQRRKVKDLFPSVGTTIVATPDSGTAMPDLSFIMSEYRYINDLQDFIFEAIPGARIQKQEDGSISTRLFNPERRAIFVDRPWYIVDGYLTSREEEVLKIPFKDIDEIKLYVHTATIKKYFEYFLWRNGIMEVTTNDVKYKRSLKTGPNYFDFQGFVPTMDFLQTTEISRDSKIPDLRTTMYWKAGDWENKTNIDVPLSDDTGKYVYRLMAISESGETVLKQGSFVIR